MSVTVTQELTQQTVTVTGNPVENNVTVTVSNARGASGAAGPNSVTSATTSDSTADLLLAAATVSGTLTASHIHGNLAGNVYGHIRAGEALAKGDPVYVSGSHGSGSTLIPIVSKADASNAAKMPAVGIMDAAVANNATGHMVITGTITELATNAYSINAELYVAAGGGMTATPPTARAQPVARVERSNANNGAIIVKVNGLSASDATASTLARRDSAGGCQFTDLSASVSFDAGTFSVDSLTGSTFEAGSSVTFNATAYTYGTGAASAHRTALGAGTTGATLFSAADAGAARTTLGLATANSPTFAGITASTSGNGLALHGGGTVTGASGAITITPTAGSTLSIATSPTGTVAIAGTKTASSETIAALTVAGGVGIASGGLRVAGTTNISGAFSATTITSGFTFIGTEIATPTAPAANGYKIYAEDNGAGKTRLMVLFATGAAQQIAIEP